MFRDNETGVRCKRFRHFARAETTEMKARVFRAEAAIARLGLPMVRPPRKNRLEAGF